MLYLWHNNRVEADIVALEYKSFRAVKNVAFGLSGGWLLCLYFMATAVVYAISIVGVKKAYALLKCASFCLAPYGKNAYTDFASHKIGNAMWAATVGWQAALICMIFAAAWSITVAGLYLGVRYFHLAQYAIAPFGAKCYPVSLLTGGEKAVPQLMSKHPKEL